MTSHGDAPLTLVDGAAEWRVIDGETVVLDIEHDAIVGINQSGSLLWEALARGTTRDDLINLLSQTYGVPAATAEGDVDSFLEVCRRRGLLA